MTSSSSPADNVLDGSSAFNQRDAWVEVDLSQLEKNVQTIKAWLRRNAEQAAVKVPKIMAVVKAAAYGHGAVAIAEVLSACEISWLAVASIDEGRELRRAGCKSPILILSPTPSWAVVSAVEQSLDLTISSIQQLQELILQLPKHEHTVPIHLKLDTGMHRLGMNINDLDNAISLLKENKRIKLVSAFSHLAMAAEHETTRKQKENFDSFIAVFDKARYSPDFYHLASCEAAKVFPVTYYDCVRIGLHLYGMESNTISSELLPILSVRARINQINSINKGEKVGYGLTWTADRQTRLANIPIGYADGVDRRLSNKIKGLSQGQMISQVGTISMDQMLFDITDVPQAKEGDVITLIGHDENTRLYLSDWANKLDTMVRELSCRLHMRLPIIYTRGPMPRQLEGKSR